MSENLLELDERLLTNYYKSNGFYNVAVSSKAAEVDESGNAVIIYSISEGKRFIIDKISTNVDSVFDKNIFFPLENKYKKVIGQFYSPFP